MVLHLFRVIFGSYPPSCAGVHMACKGEVWGCRYRATTLYPVGQIAVGVLYLGGGGKKAISRQAGKITFHQISPASINRD